MNAYSQSISEELHGEVRLATLASGLKHDRSKLREDVLSLHLLVLDFVLENGMLIGAVKEIVVSAELGVGVRNLLQDFHCLLLSAAGIALQDKLYLLVTGTLCLHDACDVRRFQQIAFIHYFAKVWVHIFLVEVKRVLFVRVRDVPDKSSYISGICVSKEVGALPLDDVGGVASYYRLTRQIVSSSVVACNRMNIALIAKGFLQVIGGLIVYLGPLALGDRGVQCEGLKAGI